VKLVTGDGRTLNVRDVGPILVEYRADGVPIKFHRTAVLSDEEARHVLKEVASIRDESGAKLYRRVI